MRFEKLRLLLSALILLAGCVTPQSIMPTAISRTKVSELLPTATLAPSPILTLQPDNATTLGPTATPRPGLPLVLCSSVDPPPVQNQIPFWRGSIAFRIGLNFSVLRNTGQEQVLLQYPQSPAWMPISLSPDGRWYGYISRTLSDQEPLAFHLYSSEGNVIEQTPLAILPVASDKTVEFDGYYWAFVKWINSTKLLVAVSNGTDELLAVFDPFAGMWHPELLARLPARMTNADIEFSPDTTRALIVAGREFPFSLVLWDVEKEQELWRAEDFSLSRSNYAYKRPDIAWSPDSTLVAFALTQNGQIYSNSYLLDRDGRELTRLRPSALSDAAGNMSWSPDGRYLAAVGFSKDGPNSPPAILIFDRQSRETTDICPQGSGIATDFIASRQLVWSPDSRFLLYGRSNPVSQSEEMKVVALNIFTGEVSLVKEEERIKLELLGWSPVDQWVRPPKPR